jgi:hypothetical protein
VWATYYSALTHCLWQVGQLGMAGVNGKKFPQIRQHLAENIGGVYKDMDLSYVSDDLFAVANGSEL